MILNSLQNGPLVWPTVVEEDGTTRTKKYEELSVVEKLQADYDPIAYLNKAMAFLTAVASSRFPSTNNQLRTSSNPRNQATIQDGKPKRPKNAAWFKEKAMLTEAQEARQILDEEKLAFLADLGIPDGQAAILMANLSNYGSDVISEVPHFELYHTVINNQSVHAMKSFEQTPFVDFTDNEITSDSNIISYS
ncbi:hypothetical protein Tco_0892735 [Tanacetum coccineum]|uniref:Uncharacterized protein n=1 Tax=Tanacetum coccineum TaxID=301880 RepID=A0ABQ5C9W2_9ASTR